MLVYVLLFTLLLVAGQVATTVTLVDDEGATHTLPRPGQPLIVVYEDQEGDQHNAAAKALLAAYHDPLASRDKADVWPIADLSKWNFWPARSSALKQVRAAAAKSGSRILVDWTGVCRDVWGTKKGTSSVIVIGADGHVLFSAEGDQTDAQRRQLEATLRALGMTR